MQINYSWLQEFIKGGEDVHQTAEWLTQGGLEVEGVESWSPVKGGLQGVVVGEIITCEQHPNADRLKVTTVNVGDRILPIVCGAPNAAQGQKVFVALPGTTIYPEGHEPLTIQKAKIRGEVSEGMICAEDELGLGKSHEGIMVLDDQAKPGTPAAEYLGIPEEQIISIGLTANRGDAASHLGVARDLAYRSQGKVCLKTGIPEYPEKKAWEIKINTEGCIRYSGVLLENVTVGPSPQWLQWRLKSIGLNPINNVVDVTNYILHGLGQPIHAFDADALTEGKIEVRMAHDNEIFTTLDGVERKLQGKEVVITSNDKPIALAGVFGGLHSGVQNQTKRIYIESACFEPSYIRRSAKSQGLSTDASFRYERGTDPEITVYALHRVTELLMEVAGAVPASAITDVYPSPRSPNQIMYHSKEFKKLIGMDLSSEIQKEILHSLDIQVEELEDGQWELFVPYRKWDVTRKADIIEEIIRIYGINEVPEPLYTPFNRPVQGGDIQWELRMKLTRHLAAQGFNEVLNNSLSRMEWQNPQGPGGAVHLLNPLSQLLGVMRNSLLPGLIETWQYNRNRQQGRHAYVEFGRTYHQMADQARPIEVERVGILLAGVDEENHWYQKERGFNWAQMHAHVMEIYAWAGIQPQLQIGNHPWFVQYFEYVWNGKTIGSAGILNKNALSLFDAQGRIIVAELETDILWNSAQAQRITMSPLPRFPEMRRDLSLVIDHEITWDQIEKAGKQAGIKELIRQEVFDVYHDVKLGEGKKSYAISYFFQDHGKTLTDEQVDEMINAILKKLEKSLGAILRTTS